MKHYKQWLVAMLFPMGLSAQDTIGLSATQVEAYRTATPIMASARNISILTQSDIEKLPVQSVHELLQHLGGVDIQQRGPWGSQTDVSIRGGSFDQALILINGLKINDPQSGHHHMNFDLGLADIERIEVIKGPAASRYGVNAFNGVINIITKTDPTSSLRAELQGSRSAHRSDKAYHGQRLAVSGNIGGERAQHRIGVSTQLSNGHRPMTESQRHALQYTGRSTTQLGQTEALVLLCDNEFGASGFYAWPIDSSSTERVQTAYAGLQHRITKSNWSLMANAYHRFNRDVYTLFREAPQVYQNNHVTHTSGATLQGTLYTSAGQFSVGGEQRLEQINSSNLGSHAIQNTGVFVSHRKQWFTNRVQSMVSVYTNFSDAYRPQWLPSAELSARLIQNISGFVSWGSALRTPTFTDRYYQGPTNIGNESLRPEQAKSLEGGFKWRSTFHFVQASAFKRYATDLIDWVRSDETAPWQPHNYAAVHTNGLDINYTLQRQIALTPAVAIHMFRVNYLYLNSDLQVDAETDSRYSLNHLNHLGSAQLGIAIMNDWHLITSAVMRIRLDRSVEWLLDTRLQFTQPRYKVWVDGSNLLNEVIVQAGAAPLPQRWVRVGLSLHL